jgi:hypothetical protein
MYGGVGKGIEIALSVDHGARFLTRGTAIQIDKSLAITHSSFKNREISPKMNCVKCHFTGVD